MTISVDVWLRGQDFATTKSIDGVTLEPKDWTDAEARLVLEGMLREMHRLRYPDRTDQPPIALRGLSWIVNPYDAGGVVIAIEIAIGAAVAGPFDIDQSRLEDMISRVIDARPRPASSATIH